MSIDINLEEIKKRKCLICGDRHKSLSDVFLGQAHIATVVVCCNCGYTMTFSHSAKEYAKYLEDKEFVHTYSICKDESTCCNPNECPKKIRGTRL